MIDPSINGRVNFLRALEDLERQEWHARMDAHAQMPLLIFDEVSARLSTVRAVWAENEEGKA